MNTIKLTPAEVDSILTHFADYAGRPVRRTTLSRFQYRAIVVITMITTNVVAVYGYWAIVGF